MLCNKLELNLFNNWVFKKKDLSNVKNVVERKDLLQLVFKICNREIKLFNWNKDWKGSFLKKLFNKVFDESCVEFSKVSTPFVNQL